MTLLYQKAKTKNQIISLFEKITIPALKLKQLKGGAEIIITEDHSI